MSKKKIVFLILIFLFFSMGIQWYLEKSVFPNKRTIVFDKPEKVFLQMVWVFRSLLADILWLKVDYYHHSKGVGEMKNIFGDEGPLFSHHHHHHHRLLNDAKKDSSLKGEGHHEEHDIKGFAPDDKRKFKIGDFDYEKYRSIQLYIPEIIPMLKLITILNPHFDKAYSMASYIMIKYLGKEKEGWKFLKEGLKNNPDSVEILFTFSALNLYNKKDYDKALKYAKKAYQVIVKTKDYGNDYWLLLLHMLKTIYKHKGNSDKVKFYERELKKWEKWLREQKLSQRKN